MGWFRASARRKILQDLSFKRRGEILSNRPNSAYDSMREIARTGAQHGKNTLLIVTIIFVLLVGGIFAFGYFSSDAGKRALQSGWDFVMSFTFDPISNFFAGIYTTGSGDYFSSKINTSSTKNGIDLKAFSSIAGQEIPAGQDFDLKYDISFDNVPSGASYTADFFCSFNKTKDVEVLGKIIPAEELSVRKGTSVVCRIAGTETADLNGPYSIFGSFSFATETKDATIPVYMIPGTVADQLGTKDFFDAYNLNVKAKDLLATYNGEPISIGIGVGGEGTEGQPVVVRSGDTSSYNTVGITLKNEWGGSISSLDDLTLTLPEGVTLDSTLNGDPSLSCPFIETGRSRDGTEYNIDASIKEQLFQNYIQNNAFFGKIGLHSFQCWLAIDPNIFGEAPYVTKNYVVDAKYIYKVKSKQETVTIKAAGASLVA